MTSRTRRAAGQSQPLDAENRKHALAESDHIYEQWDTIQADNSQNSIHMGEVEAEAVVLKAKVYARAHEDTPLGLKSHELSVAAP
jgi:hypothetical protein